MNKKSLMPQPFAAKGFLAMEKIILKFETNFREVQA